jgi:hypothetical protein
MDDEVERYVQQARAASPVLFEAWRQAAERSGMAADVVGAATATMLVDVVQWMEERDPAVADAFVMTLGKLYTECRDGLGIEGPDPVSRPHVRPMP